ncbi:hypothetical protein [Burkholderia cenocepacia]|nr:hypothetical protein [Burkholderia cenocepacia]
MPVVNVESSLDRTRFEFGHHAGGRMTEDRDSDSTGLAGGAK